MRVQVYCLNDRLYFAAPADASVIDLDLAHGVRAERVSHGRLLLTNDRDVWVGGLKLAVRLGWCRIAECLDARPGEELREG